MNAEQLCYKLNAILPKEIAVHEVEACGEEFHARFDARSREYCYFIHFRKDPFCEKFSYRMRYPLDIEAMNEAAKHLLGEHDFSCFEKTGGNNTTSICTITEAGWSTYAPEHCRLMGAEWKEGDYIVFRVKANRFLRNMVRAIVGTLVEVGRHKISVEEFCQIIEKKDRCSAGTSMPGNALFLWEVTYPFHTE